MSHDMIGSTIGGYTISARLGAGGMATVYQAVGEDGHEVALKVLSVHLAANETLYQRFMREAQMASRLKHQFILPVYDFGEDRGTPYIVMKLVDNGTLDTRIQQEGQLAVRVVARVLSQVAQALDYAHSQGVIHRDLKPENILFDRQGVAYLADFGIARIHEATAHLTGSGGFIGTAAYASPEQCRGEELTTASDIYSLGVVLYEMLTGKLPYTGPTPLAIMHKHMSEPIPNVLKDRPDISMDINDVMRKALAKLPAVRYSTAQAMSTALIKALRRDLGTRPLAEKAPPIGPNPVFNKPRDTYAAPSMPDSLIREISPTNPTRPRRAAIRQLDTAGRSAQRSGPQPAATPAADTNSNAFLLLLLFIVLVAIAVVAALLAVA
ncbi:MAG: serine/threonine protein kinase [Chloroflexi bacterium]|nr:serine/threonine protein kinase [Chloroflexota bacterium]